MMGQGRSENELLYESLPFMHSVFIRTKTVGGEGLSDAWCLPLSNKRRGRGCELLTESRSSEMFVFMVDLLAAARLREPLSSFKLLGRERRTKRDGFVCFLCLPFPSSSLPIILSLFLPDVETNWRERRRRLAKHELFLSRREPNSVLRQCAFIISILGSNSCPLLARLLVDIGREKVFQ